MKDNFTKRWDNRISVNNNDVEREHSDVLVLKSEYNTAWNYFSARELGDTVLGYWRTWFNRAATNTFNDNEGYHRFDSTLGGLEGVDTSLCTEVRTQEGLRMMPDIRKLDILNRRFIVSKKRKRNLFDLTSSWKKAVLQRLEEDVHEDDRKDDTLIPGSDDSTWERGSPPPDPDSLEFVADRFPFLR